MPGLADLRPPGGDTSLVPIILFPNQGRGFGFGVEQYIGGYPQGYDRAVNCSDRGGTVLTPSFATEQKFAQSSKRPPAALMPWQDASGVPFVIELLDTAAYRIQDGLRTLETDATTAEYASADFHDNGAGTAFLYAGTKTGSKLLNRRTQAGVWAEDADVSAIFIVAAAGALWRTTSDYQTSKCPAGSEPFTIGNWGSSIQVGTNEAKITSVGAIGAAPVFGKEDGIWLFSEADARFENKFPVRFNVNHFPFMREDGRGGLLTATALGDIVNVSQFGSITVYSLRKGQAGRDTPRGRIVDMDTHGDRYFALLNRGYRTVQPSGLVCLTTTDGGTSYNDATNLIKDRNFNSAVDISGFDNADYMLIGAEEQFGLIDFVFLAFNSTVGDTQFYFSRGAAGTTFDVLSLMNHTHDSTDTTPDTPTTFGQNGQITFSFRGGLSGSFPANWTAGEIGGYTRYWVKVQRF